MKKTVKVVPLLIGIVLLLFSVSADAAGERIVTADVKVAKGRLFEVKVGFDSDRVITASRFTFTYDTADVDVRTPVCALNKAKVKFNNKNGVTDIIFLCSGGVSCREFPTLFSMRFKKTSVKDTVITVQASDCVDDDLNNFTAPKQAVCKVVVDSKAGGSKNEKQSPKQSVSDRTNSAGSGKDSGEKDILDTSVKGEYAEDGGGRIKMYSGDDPIYLKMLPFITLFVIIAFFCMILYQNKKANKTTKSKEDENKE